MSAWKSNMTICQRSMVSLCVVWFRRCTVLLETLNRISHIPVWRAKYLYVEIVECIVRRRASHGQPLCCASRTFASQRSASHIFWTLLTIATDSVHWFQSKTLGVAWFRECNILGQDQQLYVKAIRFASEVLSTKYSNVLNVDGFRTRTLYKWEKSIAHCVDDFRR